jgi:Trypsin-like peptidase domain
MLTYPKTSSILTTILGILPVIAIVQSPTWAMSAQQIEAIARQVTVKFETQEGSGIIIAKKGNTYFVATANHIVDSEHKEFSLITPDGYKHWLGRDSINRDKQGYDLAVVKFTSNRNYQIAKISILTTERGEDAYVSGYPIGSESLKFSSGIVQATSLPQSSIRSHYGEKYKDGYSIIYDSVTVPGMSGGGVFNSRGELIAIHGLGDRTSTAENISESKVDNSFGIPISSLIIISLTSQLNLKLDFGITRDNVASQRAINSQIFNRADNYIAKLKIYEADLVTTNNRGETVTIGEPVYRGQLVDDVFIADYHPYEVGTATIIAKSGEYYFAVTTSEIISGDKEYELSLGKESKEIVSGKNAVLLNGTGLTLIKFKSNNNYNLPEIGDPSIMRAGDSIYIVGFPKPSFSLQHPILQLKLGRIADNSAYTSDSKIIITSGLNRLGMNGGGIFDNRGRLIGIYIGKIKINKDGAVEPVVVDEKFLNYGFSIDRLLEIINKGFL